jgi:hypothetical protein
MFGLFTVVNLHQPFLLVLFACFTLLEAASMVWSIARPQPPRAAPGEGRTAVPAWRPDEPLTRG